MPETLTEKDYQEAARLLGCDVAAIKAVAAVESSGAGFLKDGRIRVLFEGHQFYRYTQGKFAATHPTLCHEKWTAEYYCKGDAETRGAGEWARLEEAKRLDERAALLSCSMGKFQIMGFNFSLCGFQTVEQFWQAMCQSEAEQLKAFCAYIKAVGLDDELRKHDWEGFARRYNGPGYRKNRYHEKLAQAYQRFVAQV
jgi:hypothetical protein